MFCKNCGTQIADDSKFCPACGAQQDAAPIVNPGQVDTTAQSAVPPTPAQAPVVPPVVNGQPVANAQPGAKTKKRRGCLIGFLVLFALFIIGVVIGIVSMTQNPEKYDTNSLGHYVEMSAEQAQQANEILQSCGLTEIESVEHDASLDGMDFDGETGYRVASNDIDNIILYLDVDLNVYSIRYADHDLYADGAVVATLQDYTLTFDEMNQYIVFCEEQVRSILKSPSTASFPVYTEWGFAKDGETVTVQGYVDAQNSFGAEMRSTFQFQFDQDTGSVTSFIFDGEELL